ncbi:MAG: sortase [Candidatus Limnocylindrales bacterium]
MTDLDTDAPAPPPSRRRRRRRSSPARRIARFLGIDRARGRAAVLVVALAVLVVAAVIAFGGQPSPGVVPTGSPSAPAGSAATAATLPPLPTSSAVLPPTSSLTPIATPIPSPVGIVANRIRIPRLGIDLRIVEGDGLDAPMNKAAHYPGTGWPGGGTNIYIYAHAQTGMFLSLWQAKVGDQVVLDLVDGTTRTYVVTQVLPKVPYDALQYVAATPTEQLTLQTSTSYTPTAPRFVVIAVPAPTSSPSLSPSSAP